MNTAICLSTQHHSSHPSGQTAKSEKLPRNIFSSSTAPSALLNPDASTSLCSTSCLQRALPFSSSSGALLVLALSHDHSHSTVAISARPSQAFTLFSTAPTRCPGQPHTSAKVGPAFQKPSAGHSCIPRGYWPAAATCLLSRYPPSL